MEYDSFIKKEACCYVCGDMLENYWVSDLFAGFAQAAEEE